MSWPVFYVVVASFLAALFLIVYLPWIRSRSQRNVDQLRNAQIVKQRLVELEKEAQEGLISEKDKQQAITELKLALVEESDAEEKREVSHSRLPLAIGFVLAFGVGGVVYYNTNHIGEVKQLVDATHSIEALSNKLIGVVEGQSDITPQELQSLTLAIRQRLRKTPDDEQAWLNLGRLYMTIGFSEQSIASFKRAFELAPDDPTMRLNYAQALMLSGTDENLQRSQRMLAFEIEQQPQNDNIRLMLTVVTTQLGNLEAAEAHFAQIRERLNPDTSMYQTIVTRINELRTQRGLGRLDEASDRVLTGFDVTINISDQFRENLPQNGFLFVFAQDALTDMRMPAAVVRIPLPEFPTVVSITNENAMMENFTLDQLEQTRIVALISLDENVETSPGELRGSRVQSVVRQSVIATQITIDQELQ